MDMDDIHYMSKRDMMEGIGNEVIVVAFGLFLLVILPSVVVYIIFKWRRPQVMRIHPDQEQHVNFARELLQRHRSSLDRASQQRLLTFRTQDIDTNCPICLAVVRFAIETNCGHVFCAECLVLYWRHGTWLGPVNCPVCRQEVHVLLPCFGEAEFNQEEREERHQHVDQINNYNSRFSGLPRPWIDHLRDMPTLLRHLWGEFFSVSGLMWMFRLRIVLCFVAAVFYLASPLDILPEAVFGMLGLLDDVFVMLLLAVYVTIIYRNFLANRGAEEHQAG